MCVVVTCFLYDVLELLSATRILKLAHRLFWGFDAWHSSSTTPSLHDYIVFMFSRMAFGTVMYLGKPCFISE